VRQRTPGHLLLLLLLLLVLAMLLLVGLLGSYEGLTDASAALRCADPRKPSVQIQPCTSSQLIRQILLLLTQQQQTAGDSSLQKRCQFERLGAEQLQMLMRIGEPCLLLHALLLLHLPFPHLDQPLLLLLQQITQHAVQLLLVGVLLQTPLHSVSPQTRQLLLMLLPP
jgi:hypothetical protein